MSFCHYNNFERRTSLPADVDQVRIGCPIQVPTAELISRICNTDHPLIASLSAVCPCPWISTRPVTLELHSSFLDPHPSPLTPDPLPLTPELENLKPHPSFPNPHHLPLVPYSEPIIPELKALLSSPWGPKPLEWGPQPLNPTKVIQN